MPRRKSEAHGAAEQKIEQALTDGATKLDLSGMALTEVPETLTQLANLQTLNLSINQLTALPKTLGQLRKLRKLYLQDN